MDAAIEAALANQEKGGRRRRGARRGTVHVAAADKAPPERPRHRITLLASASVPEGGMPGRAAGSGRGLVRQDSERLPSDVDQRNAAMAAAATAAAGFVDDFRKKRREKTGASDGGQSSKERGAKEGQGRGRGPSSAHWFYVDAMMEQAGPVLLPELQRLCGGGHSERAARRGELMARVSRYLSTTFLILQVPLGRAQPRSAGVE